MLCSVSTVWGDSDGQKQTRSTCIPLPASSSPPTRMVWPRGGSGRCCWTALAYKKDKGQRPLEGESAPRVTSEGPRAMSPQGCSSAAGPTAHRPADPSMAAGKGGQHRPTACTKQDLFKGSGTSTGFFSPEAMAKRSRQGLQRRQAAAQAEQHRLCQTGSRVLPAVSPGSGSARAETAGTFDHSSAPRLNALQAC